MSRRTDQLDRIEKALASLETALAGHAGHLREQVAAVRIEAQAARSSAEAARGSADSAHAGVQALADMLPVPAPEPVASTVPVPAVTGDGTAGDSATARRAPKAPKGQM